MSIPIWVKGLRAGGGATSCALPPVPQSPNSSKLTDIDQQVTGFIGDKQTLIQNQISFTARNESSILYIIT